MISISRLFFCNKFTCTFPHNYVSRLKCFQIRTTKTNHAPAHVRPTKRLVCVGAVRRRARAAKRRAEAREPLRGARRRKLVRPVRKPPRLSPRRPTPERDSAPDPETNAVCPPCAQGPARRYSNRLACDGRGGCPVGAGCKAVFDAPAELRNHKHQNSRTCGVCGKASTKANHIYTHFRKGPPGAPRRAGRLRGARRAGQRARPRRSPRCRGRRALTPSTPATAWRPARCGRR